MSENAPELIGLVGNGLGQWDLWVRGQDAPGTAVQYVRANRYATLAAEKEALEARARSLSRCSTPSARLRNVRQRPSFVSAKGSMTANAEWPSVCWGNCPRNA
jgi:hypothetical protein